MAEGVGAPLVGVVMGSKSDYSVMGAAVRTLAEFGVAHEARVVSAHRTPDLLFEYAEEAQGRGLRVVIAGAGGAAHLPGMLAAKTIVPVLGVPVPATALQGMDALLSMVQMPKGVPVGTLAIGEAGAVNAALLAIAMLATTDAALAAKLLAWRTAREKAVLAEMVGEVEGTGVVQATGDVQAAGEVHEGRHVHAANEVDAAGAVASVHDGGVPRAGGG